MVGGEGLGICWAEKSRYLQEPGGSQFRGAEKFWSHRADRRLEYERMVLRVSKREMFCGLLRR